MELWNLVLLAQHLKLTLEMYGLGDEVEVNSKTVSLGVVLLKEKAQLEVNIGYTTSSESAVHLKVAMQYCWDLMLEVKLNFTKN
ncbi:MAG: hypothetical protein MZV64_52200 [Ignavibacteriales bacterium]|nr:hypothetical protein [Ignavibacteriales bacterium]